MFGLNDIFTSYVYQSSIKFTKDSSQAELTLENVAGIFYILSCGLTLSVVIAAIEFLYKSVVDSKKAKVWYIRVRLEFLPQYNYLYITITLVTDL